MKQKRNILLVALLVTSIIAGTVVCCAVLLVYGVSVKTDAGTTFENTGQQLLTLPNLQNQLYEEYPSQTIEVWISNGHILDVNLFNSGYLDLPDESSRQKKAKEIAAFIVENYESIDTVDTIKITFTERVSLGLKLERFLSYVFYVNDLK